MECFFIFNFGISTERVAYPNDEDRDRVIHIARRGGASHLLEVQIGAVDVKPNLPVSVSYVLLRTGDGAAIATGTIRLSEVMEDGISYIEICRAMGKEVAQYALSTW